MKILLCGIGKPMRKLRKELGLSLLDVQKKTGIFKSSLSNIENVRRGVSMEIATKILVYGFNMLPSDAREILIDWHVKYLREL
jgi:transcriptional regulator with XRE-family HTH domain